MQAKIRPLDGLKALGALLKYSALDDIYSEDDYGSHILHQLERTRRFNLWMGDTLVRLLAIEFWKLDRESET